jgi:hypothetical protein
MKAHRVHKKPIQIYLDSGQDTLIELLAKKRGISKSSIIREGVDKFLKELPIEEDPAMELIGLGSSGKGDLSENHDRYLTGHADK